MIIPKKAGQSGVVIELKTVSAGDTLPQTIEKAFIQLDQKQYRAELQAAGLQEIWEWAVAFDGKKVQVSSRRV